MGRLIIPGVVPSVNHQYRNVTVKGRKMRMLTTEAARWERQCVVLASNWMQHAKWQTRDDKTIVRLWYFWPDNRQRDTHNTIKLLLDAFESAGIYTNDRYALPQIMDYDVDRDNPRVEVEFEVKGA